MVEIAEELYIFFYAVWTGCVVYSVYFCIGIVRKMWKHKLWVISIEDYMFWILSTIYIFYNILEVSNGVLRWYFFVGLAFGVASMYMIWCNVMKIVKKVRNKIKKYLYK